ncbi:MAG: hypothetical protein ACYTXA_28740 [Nostoc sp.]
MKLSNLPVLRSDRPGTLGDRFLRIYTGLALLKVHPSNQEK